MTLGLLQQYSGVVPCARCPGPFAQRLCHVQPFRSTLNKQQTRRRCTRSWQHSRCQAVSEPQTDSQSEVQIEGIDQNYCDDFVCTSSPAVEQTLRALARDLTRIETWTTGLFSSEVRYKVSTWPAALQEKVCIKYHMRHDDLFRTSSDHLKELLSTSESHIWLVLFVNQKW